MKIPVKFYKDIGEGKVFIMEKFLSLEEIPLYTSALRQEINRELKEKKGRSFPIIAKKEDFIINEEVVREVTFKINYVTTPNITPKDLGF